MSASRADRDVGSSLIETLISVGLVVVLGGVLMTVMSTYLRVQASPADHLASTRELARISETVGRDVSSASIYWLSRDVDPVDGLVDSISASMDSVCAGYRGDGTNVLLLQWNEDFGGLSHTYTVQYVSETLVSSARLVRVACRDGESTAAISTVAEGLDPSSPAIAVIDGQTVSLVLDPVEGADLRLVATTVNTGEGIERTEDDE